MEQVEILSDNERHIPNQIESLMRGMSIDELKTLINRAYEIKHSKEPKIQWVDHWALQTYNNDTKEEDEIQLPYTVEGWVEAKRMALEYVSNIPIVEPSEASDPYYSVAIVWGQHSITIDPEKGND